MNEVNVELIKEGRGHYRELLAGKHLRPAELALTMYILVADPQWAEEALLDEAKQARWETANGS